MNGEWIEMSFLGHTAQVLCFRSPRHIQLAPGMTEEEAGRPVIGRLSKREREKVTLTSHQHLISLRMVCVARGKELSACCQQLRLCFVLKIVVPYLEVLLTEERRNEKSRASL